MNIFDVIQFLGIVKPVHIWKHTKVGAKKGKRKQITPNNKEVRWKAAIWRDE